MESKCSEVILEKWIQHCEKREGALKEGGAFDKSRCDKIRTCGFCVLKTMKRRLINAGKRGIKMSESIDFADFIELKYVCI